MPKEPRQIKILDGSIVDVDAFAEYLEGARRFGATHTVEITFPPRYKVMSRAGAGWRSSSANNSITIEKGYTWDGPSGPTFDTPSLRLASLVHDIICTITASGYVIMSYMDRHKIYYLVAIQQNCPVWRASLHYIALVGFNWAYSATRKG